MGRVGQTLLGGGAASGDGNEFSNLFFESFGESIHCETVLEEHHPAEGGRQEGDDPEDF